ncbi:FUSC family protein [Vogesella sp. LIG4]|uniref:FUSC family protein n=1 Tax=Vogesella sp. LIG4 TaxID=1192162 RepID=UPI00081FEA3D|nr:FUSC family protein [Vogesella sp. LIG4]SCK18581.1 Uncharacterized membrane protein YccC [Vogesella sp. LIG4]
MISLPTKRDWLFSAKVFAAAMLALYIALLLGLPRPYWAMGSVYIVSHPLTGATRSKAVYRVGGTLLGAAAAVLFVPMLIDAPTLLSLVIALWTGTLLYLSLLDRSPRNYLFMLSAYTMPMIALPAVSAPLQVFDIAVARSEEILLGIVCASVVSGLIFPSRVSTVLAQRIDGWLRDAGTWAAAALLPGNGQAGASSRHRLAADILALDQLISQLSYDSASRSTTQYARELRARMSMLLPILESLSSLLATLRQQPGGVPAELEALMAEIAAWLALDPDSDNYRQQARLLHQQLDDDEAQEHWSALLLGTARMRLRALVNLWQDCQTLRLLIASEQHDASWQPAYRRWEVSADTRHYDFGMLLFSAASASLAIFLGCQLWIGSGWADGASAVILGAVACCFFAALDEPAPFIQTFFVWTVVSIVLGGVLLFAVLPSSQNFETLVALLAVPFLLIGTFISQPRFSMIAMLLAVNTANFVGIQGAYNADFTSYVNGNVAGAVGGLLALIWTLLTRPFGTDLALRRLVHTSWRDLAHAAAGRHSDDYPRLTSLMLDRLGLLVPRLAASGDDSLTDGFRELRVGFSALDLQRDELRLPDKAHQAIDSVLQSVGKHFQHCADSGSFQPPAAAALTQLDTAIANAIACASTAGNEARNALVELRVSLFPQAPAYAPLPPLSVEARA